MKQGDVLFVYGTLRRGERMSLENNRHLLYLGEASINGLMYHLGAFPGVLFESQTEFDPEKPTVFGEMYMIRDASIVPVLDAYEGYPRLYGRGNTVTDCGRLVWSYFYKGDVSHKEPLRVGDWRTSKHATLELQQAGVL